MANNTAPVFPSGAAPWKAATVQTANTSKVGGGTIGTDIEVVGQSDGSTDTIIEAVTFAALGTNIATLARLFLNNGGANGTAANNTLIGEIVLPATTLSESAANGVFVWSPKASGWSGRLAAAGAGGSGERLLVCVATTVAAGWRVTGTGLKL